MRSRESEKTIITVEVAGPQPPCMERAPGQCRGCFGWEQMLEAARSGHSLWCRTSIRCDITGLTVRASTAKKRRS